MRSRKLLAFILCLITGPALAGYMTLLGAGLGAIQPAAQATFTNSSYSTNLSNLTSIATFSRAGNATQFDSSGYLTYGPNNLALNSEGVVADGTYATANVSNAGASLTGFAASIQFNDNSIQRSYARTPATVAGQKYIISTYVQMDDGSAPSVGANSTSGDFALIGANTVSTANITVTLISGSLYRVSAVFTETSAANNAGVWKYTTQSAKTFRTSGLVVEAVTYEVAARAYNKTTSAAYYGPRFDYTYNGSSWVPAGLLVEGAATNLVVQSASLANVPWNFAGVTNGSDATTAPDGSTANRLTASAGNLTHEHYQNVTGITANSAYTATRYVRKGTNNYAYLSLQYAGGAVGAAAVFDLSGTADVAASQTFTNGATIQASGATYIGNGWFRLRLTATANSTSAFQILGIAPAASGNTFSSGGEVTWNAAGTETIYHYGPQYELRSSASSYTPTGASSVTRAADVVQLTGTALSTALGSVASAFVEVGGLPVQSGTICYLQYGAGSGILLGMSGGSATTVYEQNTAGSASATAVAGSGSIATTLRAGVSWGSTGGRKLVANGGTVATDASNNELATGTVNLGQGQGTYINGWLRSFAIYNSRLPDATLQSKSIVGASY